jgi:hypothetical protein
VSTEGVESEGMVVKYTRTRLVGSTTTKPDTEETGSFVYEY